MKSQPIRKIRNKPQPGLSSIFHIISGEVFSQLFVQRVSLSIISRKLHGGLKILILFFVLKTIFYNVQLKIKFISSRRRVTSSVQSSATVVPGAENKTSLADESYQPPRSADMPVSLK